MKERLKGLLWKFLLLLSLVVNDVNNCWVCGEFLCYLLVNKLYFMVVWFKWLDWICIKMWLWFCMCFVLIKLCIVLCNLCFIICFKFCWGMNWFFWWGCRWNIFFCILSMVEVCILMGLWIKWMWFGCWFCKLFLICCCSVIFCLKVL